jgi:hypothetical protein
VGKTSVFAQIEIPSLFFKKDKYFQAENPCLAAKVIMK